VPIAGNPKKLAYDVAQGYQQFTRATLRAYNLEELKVLLFNLNVVLREVRATQIPMEDIDALKEKNVKIRRLNQAINTIQSYASLKGLKL
jgi:hypothetical protein